MSGVTGFATGMIAGALWLVFFIGLGLTARNSPGHPIKSIKRFRSSSRSLDLDVPSALKPLPQSGSQVRVMRSGGAPTRKTDGWDEPRPPRNDQWDKPTPKQSRQFQRASLRPVPDLPEPTLQVDSTSFFEPEHQRTRPRTTRSTFEQPMYQPTLVQAEQYELIRSAAGSGPAGHSAGLSDMGEPRTHAGSNMSASSLPPQGPSKPSPSPEPGYPTSSGFGPDSYPAQSVEPPVSHSVAPSLPAFAPPEPFEEPKSGRFGKKVHKEKAPKPQAPSAAQQKPKKQKKGLFKIQSEAKEPPKAAILPPTPPAAAAPPKPRFNAPFNYISPSSTPPVTPPSYPTISPSTPPNRHWGPPASFSPPASPSFGNWGPKQEEPAPLPEPGPSPAAFGPREVFIPSKFPFNGHTSAGENPVESGKWPFGLSSASGPEITSPHRDPELPAFIELSMFQDPTSADDIAAEQDPEPDSGSEEAAETSGARETWLSEDAWPVPKQTGHGPWPMDEQPAEETQLLEQHWPQDAPVREEAAGPDWTSADTPWPGETRRPAEPTWADEPPAAESQAAPPQWGDEAAVPPQWGDEAWQQQARPAVQAPADAWTHRQPPTGAGAHSRPAEPDPYVADPWAQDLRRPAPGLPADDPWAQARARQAEEARIAEEARLAYEARQAEQEHIANEARQVEARLEYEARQEQALRAERRRPAELEYPPAESPSNGRQIFVDDEDWTPLSIDLKLDEQMPSLDPVAEAAARLKAAETAIKVENGLAYVLVDDEGRPVLR
ncbi:hypothetical protein BH23ACT12_BH23ACT12_17900 [soil metagenome]